MSVRIRNILRCLLEGVLSEFKGNFLFYLVKYAINIIRNLLFCDLHTSINGNLLQRVKFRSSKAYISISMANFKKLLLIVIVSDY